MEPSSSLAIHLSRVVERAERQYPEREAIVWGEDRLTYGDLAARTSALGGQLAALGVAPGQRVGVLGRNSVNYAVTLVALARWGYVAVPLNWRLSVEALTASARRFTPVSLIYSDEFQDQGIAIAEGCETVTTSLNVDHIEDSADGGESTDRMVARPTPRREDLFAIISTGGTEGAPKGVPVTNAMVEAATITDSHVEVTRETEVSMLLPQMFHNPHLYLVPPLVVGAKVVIPEMKSFDAELLLHTIEREKVTRFLGVATMMGYLLDAQEKVQADLSSLRVIFYGGSPFARRTLKRMTEVFGVDLFQLYGQTETSVLVSVLRPVDHRQALTDAGSSHLLESAGRPLPLMDVRVVDESGVDCPKDRKTVGEIIVQGPSLMAAYWEDPERTRAKLRDGWCWTGDLAMWDADGYLYIVDRRQDMIISGGENIFPSAVEEVLYEHPAVMDAVVVGVPDPEWGEVVTAVIVAKPGLDLSEDEIGELCNSRLARYMRPRNIHFLDELPKNPSGKILRAEVKARFRGGDASDGKRRVGEV